MYHNGNFDVLPNWPPFYPYLIYLFLFVVRFPADAAALVSGLSMIVFLAVFSLIINNFSKDLVLNIIILLAMFTLTGFLYPYSRAWSEVPFSLFLILNLFFVIMHYRSGKFIYYFLAAVFTSLAALTRYAGYSIIITFSIYTILYVIFKKLNHLQKIEYLIVNSLTYIPSIVVVINNFRVSDTLHGDRSLMEYSVLFISINAFQIIRNDFGLYFLVLVGISIAVVIYGYWQKTGIITNEIFLVSIYIIALIIIYLSMIVFSPYAYEKNNLNTRFLSPIYYNFFLIVVIGLSAFIQFFSEKKLKFPHFSNIIKIFVYILLSIVLVLNFFEFMKFTNNIMKIESHPVIYHRNGFNISSTITEINDYLTYELNSIDAITVSVITNFKYYSSGALFFRKNVLANLYNTDMSYDDVQLGLWGFGNFTINIQSKGEAKQLFYHHFSQPSDISKLHISLEDYFIENGMPLWLILDQEIHDEFQNTQEELSDYGIIIENYIQSQPYHIYKLVEVKIPFNETFDYRDSPLEHSWEIAIKDIAGEVKTVNNHEIQSRVMSIKSPSGTKFRIDRPLLNNRSTYLSLKFNANSNFIFYVRLEAEDGESYILQYVPGNSDSYSEDNYVIHYLGEEFMDGNWHEIARDLDQDLFELTGLHTKKLSELMIRGGEIWLDDIILD